MLAYSAALSLEREFAEFYRVRVPLRRVEGRKFGGGKYTFIEQ